MGFTLLESLMGLVVLAAIVLAVGSAVSAGRTQSVEGQKAMLAVMAADDLLSELSTQDYAALATFDGFTQGVGAMESLEGVAYPETYYEIGRAAEVTEQVVEMPELGVNVRGMRVVVLAFDDMRTLATLETFIVEPAE